MRRWTSRLPATRFSQTACLNPGDPELRTAIEAITENVSKAIDRKLGPLWQVLQLHDERLDCHERRISERLSSVFKESEEEKPRDLDPQLSDITVQDEDPERGAVMKTFRMMQLPEDFGCDQRNHVLETLVLRVSKVEPREARKPVDPQTEQPEAPPVDSDSNSINMADQLHTCNWIRSHLEEHVDTCLPKQDVYETYRKHCENLQQRPLSAANFGKIIRDIFPNIKARRLGGRGQSKYCYSGIRRKTVLNMPLLPNLDLKNDPSELTELVQTYKQEVTEAACELICDWAQKILKRSFDTVVEIARFLVQEHIVNPRCSQAELVTSATLAGGPSKPHKVTKKVQMTYRGAAAEDESGGQDPKKAPDGTEQGLSVKPPCDKSKGSGGREQQVEALMKKLPQLLPRGSIPEKSHLTVHTATPTFTTNDSSGVKMALPITVATLSPQQQGSALPLMILNPSMTVSTATASAITKRASDSSTVAVTPLKRKRGRPRKPRPEETSPNLNPNASVISRGVIQKALPSSSTPSQLSDMSTQEPVPLQGKPELEARPILLLQEQGRAMVIQRAPVSRENRPADSPLVTTSSAAAAHLPPPTVHEDRDEVEITLTPLDSPMMNPNVIICHAADENPNAVAP